MADSWETERAAALARNSRFIEGFVEAHNVCPFARRARLEGAAVRRVSPASWGSFGPTTPEVRAAFTEIACDPAIEVLQLICPRVVATPRDWVARVKEVTDALQREHGRSVVGVAAFHPELAFRDDTPASMVPLFRRAPDPTIQWIRLDVIEKVRAARPAGDVVLPTELSDVQEFLRHQRLPSVEAEISAANAETASTIGVDEVVRRLAALAEDDRD